MGGAERPERAGSLSGASNMSGSSPVPLHATRPVGGASGRPAQPFYMGGQAQEGGSSRNQADLQSKVGRLLNDKGRSKYVSNAFWSKINDEVSPE